MGDTAARGTAEGGRCANCGACFASEAALVTAADARGTTEPPRFSLAAERAAAELEGLGGAIAAVNPHSDADELRRSGRHLREE